MNVILVREQINPPCLCTSPSDYSSLIILKNVYLAVKKHCINLNAHCNQPVHY